MSYQHVRFTEPEVGSMLTKKSYRKTPGLIPTTTDSTEERGSLVTGRRPIDATRKRWRINRYDPVVYVDKKRVNVDIGKLSVYSMVVVLILVLFLLAALIWWFLTKKRTLGQLCRNNNCAEGLVCDNGVCRGLLGQVCKNSGDCSNGLLCNDAVCKMGLNGLCRNDEQCAYLLTCENGKCLGQNGSSCKIDSDCSDPYYCINNICTLKKCNNDKNCASNEECRSGYCAKNVGEDCTLQEQCESGTDSPLILCGRNGKCGYIGGISCDINRNDTCATGLCVSDNNSQVGFCSCDCMVSCISGTCLGGECT